MSNGLNLDSIRAILGREVEEVVLTAAKANAMGLDSETIANSIGLERAEIEELMNGQDYKDVRLLVGAEQLKDRTDRDSNWDGVESTAVKKLARRVELENDTDTLLRIAAVANRAQRRTAPPKEAGPLDPSQAGQRVPLTLTRRYTERLGADGVMERTTTQQISVLNGSAINPKFEDVRQLLSGDSPAEGRLDRNGLLSEKESPALEYAKKMAPGSAEIIGDSGEAFSMQELLAAARRAKK